MNKNLPKRFISSLLMLIILSFGLLVNNLYWLILIIIVSCISFYEFNNLLKKIFSNNKYFIFNILSCLYLIIFVYTSYNFFDNPPISLVFIILICIFSDTGGYIVGKSIGGKKLTKISPNKTVSGALGSFVFSLIPIFFYLYALDYYSAEIFFYEKLINLILLCLILSFVCQLGDLIISYFKRQAEVKDTGSILPGHGGILDRIDGAIFVIPFAFLIDKFFFSI